MSEDGDIVLTVTHLALGRASDVTGGASVGKLLRGLLSRLSSGSSLLVGGSVESFISARIEMRYTTYAMKRPRYEVKRPQPKRAAPSDPAQSD